MGGWKRGLPGPVEKGSRGLAEVLLGIRGEVAAPGKQLEETGFTRPEVLGAGRTGKSETGHSCWSIPHEAQPCRARTASYPRARASIPA